MSKPQTTILLLVNLCLAACTASYQQTESPPPPSASPPKNCPADADEDLEGGISGTGHGVSACEPET